MASLVEKLNSDLEKQQQQQQQQTDESKKEKEVNEKISPPKQDLTTDEEKIYNELINRSGKTRIITTNKKIKKEMIESKAQNLIHTMFTWAVMFAEKHHPTCETCIEEYKKETPPNSHKSLLLCSACKVTSYCSIEHQKFDWNLKEKGHCHKDTCRMYVNLKTSDGFNDKTKFVLESLDEYPLYGLSLRFPKRFVIFTNIDFNKHDIRNFSDNGCSYMNTGIPEIRDSDIEDRNEDPEQEQELSYLIYRLQDIGAETCGIPTIIAVSSLSVEQCCFIVPHCPKNCKHAPKPTPYIQKEIIKLTLELNQLEKMEQEIKNKKERLKKKLNTLSISSHHQQQQQKKKK